MAMKDFSNLKEAVFSVIDLETSIKNRGEHSIGRNKASPFHPENKIVWYGCTIPMRLQGDDIKNLPLGFTRASKGPRDLMTLLSGGPTLDLLVGHNIKFDLLYLMHDPELREPLQSYFESGGKVWDTMIAEYLLTAQRSQFASLDKLSEKYGGTIKDDRLKEYWDKEIDTEDIPDTIIKPYLVADLDNTGLIFYHQVLEAMDKGQDFLNLLDVQMDALLATTMMEYNGIHFDMRGALGASSKIAEKLSKIESKLAETMRDEVLKNPASSIHPVLAGELNPGSIQQVSAILCGGSIKYKRDIPQHDADGMPILYKSGARKGQVKTLKQELTILCRGMLPVSTTAQYLEKTTKGFKLDEKSLKKLSSLSGLPKSTRKFIDNLLVFRSLTKELMVSYMGLIELTWPTDECIHGNLNHCSTYTGRLSSSAPNIQNFSSKEVKE